MIGKWKKINSKVVYKSPRFNIHEDAVILPDGSKGKYFYRKSGAGVAIIPFDGKKIYLVNQFRYVIGRRLWELPIGKAESKNYLAQAKKELKEETGFYAKTWKYLGMFYPTPGSGDSQGRVFFAQNLVTGQHNREPGESDMIMKGFTFQELEKMIVNGRIIDAWTISALYMYKLKFKI
ncbi:MAG: NUDIX hydrolase [Candidatus Doudnabacteria bacterium]|jgi:8-oxo-dGTP pyrophosphatase MutT (NUDIX family)